MNTWGLRKRLFQDLLRLCRHHLRGYIYPGVFTPLNASWNYVTYIVAIYPNAKEMKKWGMLSSKHHVSFPRPETEEEIEAHLLLLEGWVRGLKTYCTTRQGVHIHIKEREMNDTRNLE